jgi:integral membrane sensor domain MASE1
MDNNKSENSESRSIISESTSVRLSLIVGFLITFGSAVWWASSISSGLSSVLAQVSSFNTSIAELKAVDATFTRDLSEQKLKQAMFEVELKNLQNNKANGTTINTK